MIAVERVNNVTKAARIKKNKKNMDNITWLYMETSKYNIHSKINYVWIIVNRVFGTQIPSLRVYFGKQYRIYTK